MYLLTILHAPMASLIHDRSLRRACNRRTGCVPGPERMGGPTRTFVRQNRVVGNVFRDRRERRHLNVIRYGRIKRLIPTMLNVCPDVLKKRVCVRGAFDDGHFCIRRGRPPSWTRWVLGIGRTTTGQPQVAVVAPTVRSHLVHVEPGALDGLVMPVCGAPGFC
jgi:hypothetical protein